MQWRKVFHLSIIVSLKQCFQNKCSSGIFMSISLIQFWNIQHSALLKIIINRLLMYCYLCVTQRKIITNFGFQAVLYTWIRRTSRYVWTDTWGRSTNWISIERSSHDWIYSNTYSDMISFKSLFWIIDAKTINSISWNWINILNFSLIPLIILCVYYANWCLGRWLKNVWNEIWKLIVTFQNWFLCKKITYVNEYDSL